MNDKNKLSFFSVLQSTIAAAFGVQANKNRERDFNSGKPWVFITAGIIFVIIFVFGVYSVVQLVLP